MRRQIQASALKAVSLMLSESAAISESIGNMCADESRHQLWS
jgi:hypothetical protein